MSVRKSITLLTLLLSVSAAPFVAADVAGGFVARAALPRTIRDLSKARAAVADAKALVDKGDLAAARTRLKDLDKFWDGTVASSSPQTVARWRVIDRAIDRGSAARLSMRLCADAISLTHSVAIGVGPASRPLFAGLTPCGRTASRAAAPTSPMA